MTPPRTDGTSWTWPEGAHADGVFLLGAAADAPEVAAWVLEGWRPGDVLASVAARPGGVVWRFTAPRRVDTTGLAAPWTAWPLREASGVWWSLPPRPLDPSPRAGELVVGWGGRVRCVGLGPTLDPSGWIDPGPRHAGRPPPPPLPPAWRPPPAPRDVLGGPPRTAEVEAVEAALAAPADAPSSWWDRVQARLRRVTNPTADPALTEALGARNAAFLQRLLQDLDAGRTDEALRRAVSVAAGGGASGVGDLGALPPRDQLRASVRPLGGGAGFEAVDDTLSALRSRYEAAAAALEAEGRVEEAAFVLADLLGAVARAVDLLEAHARYEAAAKLAAGRGEDAVRVATLWWRAGAVDAALDAAWAGACEGPFLAAVGDAPEAHPLRIALARRLLAAGRPLAAVAALRPDEGDPLDPELAEVALAAAERLGGALAVEAALVRLEGLGRHASRARAWSALAEVVGSGDDGPAVETLAAGWARLPAEPARAGIADTLVRALLRSSGALSVRPDVVRAIADAAADPGLRADLPALVGADRPPASLTRLASDVGVVPVADVTLLPGGEVVVALGEAGLDVLAADGAHLRRVTVPCDRLVRPLEGDVVLALRDLGSRWRVHRVATRSGEVALVGELPREVVAPVHDGETWWVVAEGLPSRVDLRRPGWMVVRRAAWDPSDTVLSLTPTRGGLRVVTGHASGGYGGHVVLVDVRQNRVTARAPLPTPPVRVRGVPAEVATALWGALAAMGPVAGLTEGGVALVTRVDGGVTVVDTGRAAPLRVVADGSPVPGVVGGDGTLAVPMRRDGGLDVHLVTGGAACRLRLEGSAEVALAAAGEAVVIGDDLGRVMWFRRGHLVAEARVVP